MDGSFVNISLGSSFDPIGTKDASRALNDLEKKLRESDKWLMEINANLSSAIHKAAKRFATDYAAAADKATKTMGGSYKSIGEFLKDLSAEQREATRKRREQIQSEIDKLAEFRAEVARLRKENASGDSVARSMRAIGDKAEGAARSVGKISGAISVLTKGTGLFGNLVSGIFKGGLWEIGAAAVRLIGEKLMDLWNEQKEAIENYRKAAVENMDTLVGKIGEYQSAVSESANAVREGIDAVLAARKSELDMTERLTKATIELARQRRIAAGESAETVNAEADRESAAASAQAARRKSDAEIWAIGSRIDAARMERDSAQEELANLRQAKRNLGSTYEVDGLALYDAEAAKKARAFRRELNRKINEAEKNVFSADERIKAEEAALAAARKGREALEQEIEANELKAENEKHAKEVADAKKAADERAKAEIKAAQEVARKREEDEKRLHQQRMDDLKAEIDEQSKASARIGAVATAAQTEFDRAFAMYRDPEKAREQIAEERDYASDLKQLHKDARRYGGKWRIDELSQLMSSGDTQGVTDTLERWRRNKNFTPEVEAMVRASAAEQTKTTAEDELRKLNDRTEKLVADLKELSDTRDAKLDGIERNTNQLANKIDELLSVKG